MERERGGSLPSLLPPGTLTRVTSLKGQPNVKEAVAKGEPSSADNRIRRFTFACNNVLKLCMRCVKFVCVFMCVHVCVCVCVCVYSRVCVRARAAYLFVCTYNRAY